MTVTIFHFFKIYKIYQTNFVKNSQIVTVTFWEFFFHRLSTGFAQSVFEQRVVNSLESKSDFFGIWAEIAEYE